MTPADFAHHTAGIAAGPPERLTVHLDAPLPLLPTRERRRGSLGIVRCTNKVVTLNREIEELLLLRPGAGPVLPGALLPANAALASERPDHLLVPTAARVLRLLVGGKPTAIACNVDPEPGALAQAVPALLAAWAAAGGPGRGEGIDRPPARTPPLLCSKAYDFAQLALDLAMAPAWASPELRAQLEPGDPRDDCLGEQSVVVARLQQVQFSVVADAPADAVRLADPLLAEAGCAEGVAPGPAAAANPRSPEPLACVQRVDYGRIVFVKMQTRGSPMRMDAEAALRLALGERPSASGASARHERIAAESSFTVLIVGEGDEGALRIEQPSGPVALRALLAQRSPLEAAAPAGAIACRLHLLAGWRPLSLQLSTRYNHLECVVFEPGRLVLRHNGPFTARFALSWELEDDAGGTQTARWASGPQAAGWSHTLSLDGDVRNLRIEAWSSTGPAWDPWVQVFAELQPGPVNRSYTLEGSADAPRWRFRDLPPA